MVVDPRTVGPAPLVGGQSVNFSRPTFGESWSASTGFYLDPIAERFRNVSQYGLTPDPDYDWRSGIPEGMSQFAGAYARAVNADHAAEITRAINESLNRRDVMARAPFAQQFAAEMLNPINLVGLPVAGPASAGIRGIGGAALRGGVAAGATEALLSGVASVSDPTITGSEIAVNSLFTGLFGGALTGGASIPAARRLGVQQQMQAQFSMMDRLATLAGRRGNVDFEALASAPARENRALGQDDTVETVHAEFEQRAAALQRELNQLEPGSGESRIVQDQLDELRAQQQPYSQELYLRDIEAEGLNVSDLYRPSAGGDNWFLNWVSTPMRRAYTSNWGNEVKRTFHLLAGDGGTQLNLHLAGQTDGLSVYQRSATEMGQYANVHLRVLQSWADDTNAPSIGSSRLAGTDLNTTSMARRLQNTGDDFASWITEVNRRRVMGEEMSEAQAAAAAEIDRYFTSWEQRLIETGQIRTRENMGRQINRLEDEISALESELARAEAGARTDRPVAAMEGTLRSRQELLAELQFELENLPSGQSVEPYNPRYWNTGEIRRNRDRFAQILREHYEESPYIFTYNKQARKWERTRLSTDPDAINARVENTIDTILGQRQDVVEVSELYVGSGRGGNIRARQLDIPNSRVWEFIEQNPMVTLRNYAARTAPQYHFRKTFGGKTRQQVVDQFRNQMRQDGRSAKEIARATRDFNHMYDRVVGAVLRDPESWDQRVAEVLRFAASTTYLGGAGLAAVADAGRLIMDTDMGVLARAMPAFFDRSLRQTSVRETRLAGAALELLLGSAGQRVVDDQMFNFMNSGRMDRIQSAFHIMNGLGPVTVFTKQFAGMTGAHMIIEASQRVRAGDATAFDRAFLARLGVDEDAAGRISDAPWQADVESGLILPNTEAWSNGYTIPRTEAGRVNVIEAGDEAYISKLSRGGEEVAARYDPTANTIYFNRELIEGEMFDRRAWTSPRMEGVDPLPDNAFSTPREFSNFVMWHEIMHTRFSADDLGLPPQSAVYENRINQMAMEQHRNSMQVADETVEIFRGALNTHINNTIITATPADKPIIMDGVVYVPDHIGARFGLEPDTRNPGYSRVENGLLALPFQFYSFSLANVNKTVGLMMQGAVRNRLMGVAAMMAMGYMVTAIRTPDYVWDNMSPQDKLARSFDMSGVAALYSDLMYTTMQTTLAMGGPNLTGGILQPRYPQQPSAVDAITNVTGAASGWTADMIMSMMTFAGGDYGEGASQFIRNLPFSNLWFLKNDVNQLGRYISG